ncbi:MAG: Ig-like domain-containing protein, partial [Lachnospiraceae bacterium]|nr:Ig-like domain-containing protein [Lachnospiraceae bacterium]
AAGDGVSIARLDDAIDLVKKYGPNTMINLDHCFSKELFVACYSLFRETDMLEKVFIKESVDTATMNSWYAAAAESWNSAHADDQITADEVKKSILYVYVIGSADDTLLQSRLDNGDNLVMAEIVIADEVNDAEIKEKLEPWCLEHNVAMFVNTMWHGLCSTKDDCETTWAEMLDRGYTAIQTDHASELAEYLYDYGRSRDSIETIQAEHFHLFNYDSYSFQVPVAADEKLNKQVTGMGNGDWISYQNIIFDGNENLLKVNCKGLSEEAVLNFYLDEMTEDHFIASLELGASADFKDIYTLVTGNISAGTHTVYIQATGTADTGLLSVDCFSFERSVSLDGEADICQVKVETKPGVAPVLPQTVEVTIGGNSYNLKVSWEQIAAENYAGEGEFKVLGYIPVLKSYTQALVTVRALTSDIVQDEHLALWLDASSGVTVNGNAVTEWASKVGDIVATVSEGSPTVVANAIGNQTGIQFDGDDIMDLIMPDNFWNDKSEFTVLLFNAPEATTKGSNNGTSVSTTNSQDYSILYFYETSSWGSAYFTASQNEVMFRFGSGVSSDYGTSYVRETNIGNTYTCT